MELTPGVAAPGEFVARCYAKYMYLAHCLLRILNKYEKGVLKMIDLETMIKSVRLNWQKKIFGVNDGTCKSCIRQLLKRSGGLFVFHCNYDVKDVPMFSHSSVPSYFNGGRNFELNLTQGKTGKI